jgi:molybdenum cofactor cytidylyltransferase
MIAGLILAAGESRRMGRDKALLTFRGRTFIENILQNLRAAGIERVTVVLGHHADLIQSKVNLASAQVVVNPDYQHG